MNYIKVATLFISLLFGFSSVAKTDTTQIKQLIKQYETALNTSKTSDVLALYSQQPIFMPQHAPAQIGREAVQNAYNHVFNTLNLNVEFTVHDIEILGDTAWGRTSSSGKTTILANEASVTEGNNELFIFKKEAGEWRIHQYLFATNQPR